MNGNNTQKIVFSWCKGLTKETDDRVRLKSEKTSITSKKDFASGKRKVWTAGLTKETDERLKGISIKLTGKKKIRKTTLKITRRPLSEEHKRSISKTKKERYARGEIKVWNSGLHGEEYLSHYKNGKTYNWLGGDIPYYGSNWTQQKDLALKRANYQCEISGENRSLLNVHHITSIREILLRYLEIVYSELYDLVDKDNPFNMFEQRIRIEHKNYYRYKGIPPEILFPDLLWNEINHLDNLVILTRSNHSKFEGMPPGFFDVCRKINSS